MSLTPALLNTPRSSVAEPLAAVGPGPFLLPDEVALPLDVGGKVDRLGRVGSELLVRSRESAGSGSGRAAGSSSGGTGRRATARWCRQCRAAVSAPSGLKKLRSVQLASSARALPGAVAELAGDRVRRRRLELDVEVDGPPALRPAPTRMSALATSVVAISARRRSSSFDRWNGSPRLNRAMSANMARS